MKRLSPRSIVLFTVFAIATAVLLAVRPGASGRTLDPERPRVRLIATGGSISARPDGTRLTADALVGRVPELHDYVRPEWEQFSNVASSAMSLEQWVRLARRINQLFERDAELHGIVITAGTDTLEELAYFLHLAVHSERPVVLAGAMRTPDSVDFDGPANLLAAFRTAAHDDALHKGVLVVMNGEINSAREVVKTDAQRLDAFQSPQYGALGAVDAERVRFTRAPSRRHTTESEFDLSSMTALPRVDILLFYQDANPDLVRSAIDLGAQGLVLAVAGADTTAGSLGPGLIEAARRGIPLVLSTRTGGGRISHLGGGPGPGDFIAADDLPPLKARILLALALTRRATPATIRRMFEEY